MKQFFVFFLMISALIACNNEPIEGEAKGKDDQADQQEVAMPYTVTNKPDWQKGNKSNVAIAMNALKAYESNNLDSMQQYLADSVVFNVDNMSFKGSRDSLIHLLKQNRDGYSNVVINMHDYESVKSKDRGEEWVGLWYTETATKKNGQVDSVFVMDDLQIKNGKVSEIDSKMRRLPR